MKGRDVKTIYPTMPHLFTNTNSSGLRGVSNGKTEGKHTFPGC